MTPFAYLNGQRRPLADAAISLADAGFVFAATVTDFARTYRGRLFRWPQHLARFRHDAAALGIPIHPDDAALTAMAEDLVARHALVWPGRELAVISFATPGPLPHLLGGTSDPMPTLGLHAFPIDPARYRRFFSEGVVLWPVAAMADPLPSVKHRSRLRWWLADQALRADATAPAGALALPCENDGSPTETAVGSLLLVVGDRLITPAPPDVLESVSVGVVAEIAPSCGLVWERRPLSRDDVAVASEALLTGTAFGLAGVRQLGLRVYEWPGPRTLALQQAWGQFTGVHPATEFATEP